jgi:colanic acid/amylovoran biosynthesis glycosyltransferase
MSNIIIYRDNLFKYSENFISDHYENLTSYRPYLLGRKIADQACEYSNYRYHAYKERNTSKIAQLLFYAGIYGARFNRYVEKVNPSLIHAHFATDATDVVTLARKMAIPLVVTLHGYDVNKNDSFHFSNGFAGRRYLVKRSYLKSHCSKFIAVSEYIRNKAIKIGYPEDKIIVNKLGINLDKFRRSRDNVSLGKIVFVGRLVEKKGVKFLLESLNLIKNSQDFTCEIIGDGPLLTFLQQYVTDNQLNVTFLGAKSREYVRSAMSSAAFLCMPSMPALDGDNEGLPVVAMEAQAVGCPIVAFRQGPIVEAVKEGQTALLANPGDVGDFAQCIAGLLTNENKVLGLSAAATKFAHENFDISQQTKNLEGIYDELLGCKK